MGCQVDIMGVAYTVYIMRIIYSSVKCTAKYGYTRLNDDETNYINCALLLRLLAHTLCYMLMETKKTTCCLTMNIQHQFLSWKNI